MDLYHEYKHKLLDVTILQQKVMINEKDGVSIVKESMKTWLKNPDTLTNIEEKEPELLLNLEYKIWRKQSDQAVMINQLN